MHIFQVPVYAEVSGWQELEQNSNALPPSSVCAVTSILSWGWDLKPQWRGETFECGFSYSRHLDLQLPHPQDGTRHKASALSWFKATGPDRKHCRRGWNRNPNQKGEKRAPWKRCQQQGVTACFSTTSAAHLCCSRASVPTFCLQAAHVVSW